MMVTVIGESGSGKSEYAENLIMELAGGSTNRKLWIKERRQCAS